VVSRLGEGRIRVDLDADPEASLVTRGLAVAGEPWYGDDTLVASRSFEVLSERAPMVGVSRRTPPAVRAFLAGEGLPLEESDDRGAYGAYVDVADMDWSETVILDSIEQSPGPLVRLSRWPNGARSALAVTGDIDALTLKDFVMRSWETRQSAFGRSRS
jgi:hypothetical protein